MWTQRNLFPEIPRPLSKPRDGGRPTDNQDFLFFPEEEGRRKKEETRSLLLETRMQVEILPHLGVYTRYARQGLVCLTALLPESYVTYDYYS